MAVFGIGGAEWWIIFVVMLLFVGPAAVVGLVIWRVAGRKPGDASATAAAGWFADPGRRHELRYWSGSAWTVHVSDNGVQSDDSL